MSVRGKLLKRSGLLKAKDGDVLVIRYSVNARAVAPAGVDWSVEPAP